jgi:hypothetical protein
VQHPPGHDVASHAHVPLVVEHSWPVAQAAHADPAAPHWAAACEAYGTHWPVSAQHPSGHELGPQVDAASVGASEAAPSSPGCASPRVASAAASP